MRISVGFEAGRSSQAACLFTGREELEHSRGLGLQGPCGLSCGGVRGCF